MKFLQANLARDDGIVRVRMLEQPVGAAASLLPNSGAAAWDHVSW